MSYYSVREEQLIKELQLLEKTSHPVVKGNHLEGLLKKTLQEELPRKYSVGSGFVIGLAKQSKDYTPIEAEYTIFRSKEMDVIIFDEFQNTRPLKLGEKSDFYVEAVKAVIAVKRRIDKTELIKAKGNILDNLISAKKILPHSFRMPVSSSREGFDVSGTVAAEPIISIGFGYEGINLSDVKKYLDQARTNVAAKEGCYWYDIFPDIIAILGKGILYLNNQKYKLLSSKEKALEDFFAQLLLRLDNRENYIAGVSNYSNYL